MKEATGELNITVITIVAIAAVAALFYAVVWPSISASMALTSACNSGPETKSGDATNGQISCTKRAANGTFTCTFKKNNKTTTKTCQGN